MFQRLEKYFSKNHIEDILSRYDEPWRYFHTRKHLEYIVNKLVELTYINEKAVDMLYLATLFHDAVYLPWSKTNEEDSEKLFREYWNNYSLIQDKDILDTVSKYILDSKSHSLDSAFNMFDMHIVLREKNPEVLLEWEEGIFKEFSFVPYNVYKKHRLDFLQEWESKNESLKFLRNYVESRRPKVGFYAGSFNPFHKGHLSIVNQGKEIYDKVVILIGQNAAKAAISSEEAEKRKMDVFKKTGVEVEFFHGLLPEYIKRRCSENGEECFLIRGIRNEEDFKNEVVQARYMSTIWGELKIVYLTCPNELNFISSSGIKAMNSASEGSGDIFIPKDLF